MQFYLTENTAQNDNITINAGSTVQLSAPDYAADLPAGVLFYQDRNNSAGINYIINGQTDLLLDGILYLPNADVQFAGGASADPTATVIIADTITFTGDSEFGDYVLSPVASVWRRGLPPLITPGAEPFPVSSECGPSRACDVRL